MERVKIHPLLSQQGGLLRRLEEYLQELRKMEEEVALFEDVMSPAKGFRAKLKKFT